MMITDFCPGPKEMEPLGAFLLQKQEVGSADSRTRTAQQADGKPQEALAGSGRASSEPQRGPLTNELILSMVPFTQQPLTVWAVLK